MREHKEVIQAWLDGKDIQFKSARQVEWADFTEDLVTNPMTFQLAEWRIKPELKKVDYQVLIDSKLLVKFTMMHHAIISRLTKINWDNLYMDDNGTLWDGIMFEEGLKQVVIHDTAKALLGAGFEFEKVFTNYTDSHKDVFHTIILKGVREGYTL